MTIRTMDDGGPFSVSGVVPSLAQCADLGPPRSEIGVGCLMPWNGKLYVLNYVSHRKQTGTGTGLRVIDEGMRMTRHPEACDGTYANRYVHHESNRMIIGPHVVEPDHTVHTVPELVDIRVTGTARHLKEPDTLVYVLGMEGELFELNVLTLDIRQIFDLQETLGTDGEGLVHFKDCYACFGRLVVCSNEYHEPDWAGGRSQGRLAEWNGEEDGDWVLLEEKPFVGLYGRGTFGGTIFATGWDRASALLKVFTAADETWRTYRLPKASHCFDHKWQTEWPRMRETEHERILMDHHGMWYEMSPFAYGNRVWGIRPISTHLWVHGDFCSWRGMLVVGADNASPSSVKHNHLTAEPQSGIWFGRTDDLWQLGAPKGWGGPWWSDAVAAGVASDPYLMTGFEHKCLHLANEGAADVRVTIEVDFKGCGDFHAYRTEAIPAGGYAQHTFPDGFSAHWVRLVPDAATVMSAQLFYT